MIKPIAMTRRTASTSRRLVGELVERVSASAPGAGPGTLLAWLSTCVGCDSSVFMPSPDRRIPPTEYNKEGFSHLSKLYVDEAPRYQPSLAKCVKTLRRDGIYVDNDVYSSSERRELPFYADIIRPQGITSQLIIGIYLHGVHRGAFYLSKHGPVTRFRSTMVERIRPIIPSLGLVEAAASTPTLPRPPVAQQAPNLGVREREVARLAGRGLETKEIATLLGVSPATVRNQLHTIYRKLDVSNRAELAFVLAADQHS
jgi:DNA-binding CsgD family transcriptional regulator